MRNHKAIIAAALLFAALASCISYDKALLYKKNYSPGFHAALRFDGFYAPYTPDKDNTARLFPLFFYSNGSTILCGFQKDVTSLRYMLVNDKKPWGYWGNYKIDKDTVTIETFAGNGGTWNEDRELQKGVIFTDSIVFFEIIDRKGVRTFLRQVSKFLPLDIKPDSTQNWIRQKRKYNR